MVTDRTGNWTVRGMTFVLWAAAAASAAYWGLKLGGSAGPGLPVAPPARAGVVADPAAVARLLGQGPGVQPVSAGPAAASATARFQLLGVVAEGARQGAALIAVDGRPARPFRVGASVDEGLVLQSVRGRQAVLGASLQGPGTLTLDLPAPVPGAAGGAPVAAGTMTPPSVGAPAPPSAANIPMPPPGGMPPAGAPPVR